MIKLGSLPSLFPSLVSDITQKSELTVTRHCANKLKKRKSFEEGDLVVVYDNDNDNLFDVSDLSEDLELPNNHNNFNNNVMNVNHNRRGCRELYDLGPTTHVCVQEGFEGRRLENF